MAESGIALAASWLTAFVLSCILTPPVRRLALATGLVDAVRPDRLHAEDRPRGGGIAIMLATALPVACFVVAASLFVPAHGPLEGIRAEVARWATGASSFLPSLAIGAVLFFVIGLIDDRWRLAAGPKLLLQTLAAGVVVLAGGIKATVWLTVPGGPELLSILWILAVVNAYNMFDHADGLAPAAGAVMMASLSLGQAMVGEMGVALSAGAAAGALAGFLVLNFPPARIFMGDSGSMFVGYLLAALAMLGRYWVPGESGSRCAVFAPVAVLAVPLFDAVCVTMGRVLGGRSPFVGDATSHLAHRMLGRGWSSRAVVLVVAALAATTCGASLAMYRLGGPLTAVPWVAVAGALAAMLRLRRPATDVGGPAAADAARQASTQEGPTTRLWRTLTGAQGQTAVSPEQVGRVLRLAVVVLAAAALLVLPQFTSNANFAGVRGLPGPPVVLGTGLALLLMAVLVVASWAAEGRVRIARPWLALPAALVVLGVIISTCNASDKMSAMVRGAEIAAMWVGAVALAQAVRGDADRRFLAAALVAAALVVSLAAIHQAAVSLPATWEYYQSHRMEVLAERGIEPDSWLEEVFRGRFFGGVQASLGHPNVLGSFLTLAVLVAVGLGREKWSESSARGSRALAVAVAAVAAVCTVALVLTKSRAAVAALAVGLWWLGVSWWVKTRWLRAMLYAAPLAAGLVTVAAAWNVEHPAVAAAMKTLRYRLDYWQATWQIIRRYGLTGVGLENFGHHYCEHKVPWSPEEVMDPHQMLLSVVSQLGVCGAAGLAALWVVAVVAWLRAPAQPRGGGAAGPGQCEPLLTRLAATTGLAACPMALLFWMGWYWGAAAAAIAAMALGVAAAEDPRRLEVSARPIGALRGASVAALLAFALQEQIGTAILEPPTAWAMLVVIVISLGPAAQKERAADGLRPQQGDAGGVSLAMPLRFILVVFAMAAVYAYVSLLMLPVGREHTLLADAAWSADPSEKDEILRAAAAVNPFSWEPAVERGRAWQQDAATAPGPVGAMSLEKAVAAYHDAIARHPRLRWAYLALADCRLMTPGAAGQVTALSAARGHLQEAVRLYPTDISTHLRLAWVIDRLGDKAAAILEYREVLRLDDAMAEPTRRLKAELRGAVESRVRELEGPLARSAQTP